MILSNKVSKIFRFTCYHPDGSVAWVEEIHNLTPNEMLDKILKVSWVNDTPIPNWYMLLVNHTAFTAFDVTDTAAQIGGTNGWTEFTSYMAVARPAVIFGAVASQSVDNTANLTNFAITVSGTLQGAALVSTNTKNATMGILGGEGAFASPQTVTMGDTIMVQVTATEANA